MAVNKQHWNILHTASRYRRKDIVEYLLQNPIVHANVEARDENGWTAMHHAIIGGDFDVAKCLITKGNAMVNATNRDKWTALHYACRNGYFDVVRSLINDFGANITAVNKFGQTPRDVA
jgi:ankyrin repeat protein